MRGKAPEKYVLEKFEEKIRRIKLKRLPRKHIQITNYKRKSVYNHVHVYVYSLFPQFQNH